MMSSQIIINGIRRNLKTCSVCGKEFKARGNQKTCGHLCSDTPRNLKNKSRKSLEEILNSIPD